MKTIFRSLRWRIQVWHGLILLVVIFALCHAVYRLGWGYQVAWMGDREMVQKERALVGAIFEAVKAHDPDFRAENFSKSLNELLKKGALQLPAEQRAVFSGTNPGYCYFIFADKEGRVFMASENAPKDVPLLAVPKSGFGEDIRERDHFRESLHASPDGVRSVVGRDLAVERDNLRSFAWKLGLFGTGFWALGLVGGWWLAGRAIGPIKTISDTASRIAAGKLEERISISATESELTELSRILNASFDQLKAAVERQRQFTADASHELRTPVTVLLAETQRALRRDRPPEEYQAALQTCQRTAERMRGLVESLLALAKHDATQLAAVKVERVDLAQVARESVERLRPLATSKGIRLEVSGDTAPCEGVTASLASLVDNLVSNAVLHHDRSEGEVKLSTGVEGARVFLRVEDDGPGIPEAALPHLFSRFFRADAARTQGSGHTGLGLAIAQAIAANHKGNIVAANAGARGAVFTLTIAREGAGNADAT